MQWLYDEWGIGAMIYRTNSIYQLTSDGDIGVQGGTVTVYPPGGIVAQTSTGNTITLHGGHGFVGGEKFMRGIDLNTYSGLVEVESVSGNTLTLSLAANYTVDAGDRLVNLGDDFGVGTPNFNGSSAVIYSTPNGSTVIDDSIITLDEGGGYEYWYAALNLWEVVRNAGGNPVSVYINAALGHSPRNVKEWGAVGDGVTDDTAAIQTALDSFQDNAAGSTGGNGGELFFPNGVYMISAPLLVGSGVNIVGEGALSSVIRAKSTFSGTQMLLFQKRVGQFANNGIGMRYIQVDGNSQNCHGIHVYKGYDAVTFDTVYLDHIGFANNAFRFEPDPNDTSFPPNGVSQTILLNNCYAIHGPIASTGEVFYFKSCQELTLVNCKGFGGYAVATGNCDVMHFDGCRGVTVVGGAVAISQGNGIHIKCTTRGSQGLAFYGVTIEAVGVAIKALGNPTLSVDYLTIHGTRKQEGAVSPPVTTGGFDFDFVEEATIDSSPHFTLTVGANCSRVNFHTNALSNLLSDAGVGTKVVAGNSSATGSASTVFGQSIALFPNDETGPQVYWGHRATTEFWRMFWSRGAATDNGFYLRYVDTGGTPKEVIHVDADAGNIQLFNAGTQVLEVLPTGIKSSGYVQLVDGMTAPSTVGGYASIYVDQADGDLKVKFGDGTVKTIVTDT